MNRLIRKDIPADEQDDALVRWRIIDDDGVTVWRSWTFNIGWIREDDQMNARIFNQLRDKCIKFNVPCTYDRQVENWGETR